MRIYSLAAIAALTCLGFAAAGHAENFELRSQAFTANAAMPQKYTCEGDNISPPLLWTGVPSDTQSLALTVDDPDAPDPAKPTRDVVHWVVYNIRPATDTLSEATTSLPAGAKQGINEKDENKYMGPCPPIGRHRYFFKLYALDTTLTLAEPVTKAAIDEAIKGHILAKAELIGTYQKAKK